jgi:hypothetical protein
VGGVVKRSGCLQPRLRQWQLDGATQLRNRLLEARGWRVVSVPAVQWTSMTGGKAAQLAYLKKLIIRE